jgi:hypothetical protein
MTRAGTWAMLARMDDLEELFDEPDDEPEADDEPEEAPVDVRLELAGVPFN